MDIPSPDKAPDEQKIEVATGSSVKSPLAEIKKTQEAPTASLQTAPQSDLKDEALVKGDTDRKKVIDMISTKKYFLPIKEKRQNPALTFAFLPKKSKKTKKTNSKKTENIKKPKTNSKQTLLIVILVVVLVATVIAIDAGVIDIGVKLPFHLIKKV
jgi:hypothetical protein